MNTVFRLVNPVVDRNMCIFKVTLFIKWAQSEQNTVFYSLLVGPPPSEASSYGWKPSHGLRARAWEVARTVVAPPSSVVKCLYVVFVWGCGVLFLSCARVSVSGVLFSVGVCVCV